MADTHADQPKAPATTSARLAMLGRRFAGRQERVALGDIIDGLGQMGLGMTLLLLTLPALIPIPGPFGLVFGSILAFVSIQLIFGVRRLWLPALVRQRSVSPEMLDALITRGVPLLRRVEHWTTPRRLLPLSGKAGRIALALPLTLMAITLALPVPFGNVLPAASLIALSLGLITRDGVAILVGLLLAVAAALWMATLLMFGTELISYVWRLFGAA